MLRSLGLRGKVALSLTVCAILPLLVLLALYLMLVRPKLESQAVNEIERATVSVGELMNRTLADRFYDAQAFGLNIAARSPDNWGHVDGSGPLVEAMNEYVRVYKFYRLSMLVDTSGKVLAVNTRDPNAQAIETAELYEQNFAEEAWLKAALNSGTATLPAQRVYFVSRIYKDDGVVIPFAAQVKNSDGQVLGVWVNFVDFALMEKIVEEEFMKRRHVDPDTRARLQLIDMSGKRPRRIMALDPELHAKGYVRNPFLFGTAPDASLDELLARPLTDDKKAQTAILADEVISAGAAPAVAGFAGLGWRVAIRMPKSEAFASASAITRYVIAALAFSAMASLVFGLWFGGLLTKPILVIAQRMRNLAEGDTETPVPFAQRTDDIGQMAKAVVIFQNAAIQKDRVEREASEQRSQSERERRLNEDERAALAKGQTFVVGSLATALERLSSGDLTCRLADVFEPEYEKLRADFNAAMSQLEKAIKEIAGNVHSFRSGTSDIASSADDLSRRTEQQAASLEQTATALDQITATVKKTADGSSQAREIVASAKAGAEQSQAIVRNAVAAMSEIAASAQQISQIIGVIDEIAFQTNLLALNAGVEAARAGDAGRGFAVVAQEVRALAQRSAEAAKEIKGLILASTRQVGEGVQLVGQTGDALQRIVREVAEINAVVVAIAASAQEQARGLNEVNGAVNQMDQVTQQNAAMVEEQTAASHSLTRDAEQLAQLVGEFKISEPEDIDAVVAFEPALRQRPMAVHRTGVSGGGAATNRHVEVPPDPSWDEF